MRTSPTVPALEERPSQQLGALATWFSAGLIVLAGLLAYANCYRNPFVFDDDLAIVENRSIRGLWPLRPVLSGATNATVIGRPLLNLSLALNYAWGGLDVRGYHVVNVALHILTALVLFGLVRRTLLLPRMPRAIAQDATAIALVSALLWTVHPLQTESVTYIVQRAESLVALFYLLTLYCLNRSATSSATFGWSLAAVLACYSGMASKEVMVSAPLMALVYDRLFLADSFRDVFRKRSTLHGTLFASWFFLALLMSSSGGRSNTAGFGRGMSSWDYAMTQFGAIAGYLRLCFVPEPLILDYGAYVARTPAEIIPYAALIAALLAATAWALRFHPRIGFLGLCFFALLAPSSSVVPLITQTIAEHRMYLPLACIILLSVLGAREAWRRLRTLATGTERGSGIVGWGVPVIVVSVVVLGLVHRTYVRNHDYRSLLAIWQDNARKRPNNPRSFYSIAAELAKARDLRGAIANCDTAIAIDPQCFPAYLNRGNAYAFANDSQRAFDDYARVVELNPRYFIANYNLGLIHAHFGRNADALREYSRAIELYPDYVAALYERALLFEKMGQHEQAIADFSRVIQLEPAHAPIYLHRSKCYFALRHYDEAWNDVWSAEERGGQPDADYLQRLKNASGRDG